MKQSVKMIVGNWKMNGLAEHLAEAVALRDALTTGPSGVRVGLCPPATLVARMASVLDGSRVEIGGQDCHAQASGAFTGSVSAPMLVDAGARLVILGHSERRAGCGETDSVVAAKVRAAVVTGLEPILCVGETLAEHQAGEAVAVVTRQIEGSLPDIPAGTALAVAYEPVWAIGSGLTPTADQIAEVHAAIRAALSGRLGEAAAAVPILYGGSVNPGNAADLLAIDGVDGALVGGAALKAADFLAIIHAAGRGVAADAQG
ncbi:MAG: triose-phosphate isomerase [Brevundimonas sp.]|uniref:triose-phosphate isomerase n=1 Tax=Brevundimonas sp. TaxID=1871086 RepID=UPI002734802D|nr:triose-phosphate isomerase [Brevundimonas sp.]MDP3406572.1 triose-phosphate isomerase [Brevundimonas sp.]